MRVVKQLGLAGALAGLLTFGACSSMGMRDHSTWTMRTTEKAPAAQGKVVVTPQKDGNTDLKVEVAHLAAPGEVYDGTKSYVVWLKPAGGPAQNVGVLNLGKGLDGKLETKTPFKTFDVLVTAEDSGKVTTPSGNRIFNTSIQVPT
jgi:hypothetical protein